MVLLPLGITMMSAGARTEPGGYTGAGREKIHHTERGIIKEIAATSSEWAPQQNRPTNATGQFNIGGRNERRRRSLNSSAASATNQCGKIGMRL